MIELLRRATRPAALGLIAASLALTAAAKWVWPHTVVQDALVRYAVTWLRLSFALALMSTILAAWRMRAGIWRERQWLAAALLVAVTGPLAAWHLAPAGHKLFFDEDIYMQVGVSMAVDGRAGLIESAIPDESSPAGWRGLAWTLNKEPSGFPFFVALACKILGVGDSLGRSVNLVFFGMGILGLALLLRESSCFRAHPYLLMIAPIIHALWPENLRWAVCAVAEPGATALAMWALAFAARAGRTRHPLDMMAACSTAVLAAQMRPEGLMILVPAAILVAGLPGRPVSVWVRELRSGLADAGPWLALVAVLLCPHAMHIASAAHEDWGSTGAKFTTSVLAENLAHNAGYWFLPTPAGRNTPRAPWGFFPLAVLGAVLLVIRAMRLVSDRGDPARREITWIAAVFAHGTLFFGIFLPFYAGSYHYGVDVRFSLLVVPVYAILVGTGIARLASMAGRIGFTAGVVTVLGLVFVPLAGSLSQVPVVTEEARQARADHEAVGVMAARLPADAVVVSHTPSQWAMRRVAAVQVVRAWADPGLLEVLQSRYPVFYHFNYWDIAGTGHKGMEEAKSMGQLLLSRYESDTFAVVESGAPWTFTLLRLGARSTESVVVLPVRGGDAR